ncbi:OLC1v1011679C1 [Oldenlandia corymbosa var. corymbosa]|uniref:OLC1v1011679C1 n=1 Tax=Oldenlandia corymbosa var. corymbosa TaxID=529605 RepID=A0AAV1DWK9_OLDCO|nr:OLC1v1011679C1 [Oldenlandia corymbosa var. corymbosa]
MQRKKRDKLRIVTISSLILALIVSCFARSNKAVHEDFLNCMSTKASFLNRTSVQLQKYVHSQNSSDYKILLRYGEKNPRWINTSSASPLVVITPNDEFQIQHTILCSQNFDLQVRIKSGGHDYEGLSYRCQTPFVLIDLYKMKRIKIDLKRETAWIQTGVTLGQLYYEIANKSNVHAFPGGLYPSVGSGGLISGGGFGTLVRKYGLAADNVIDARVMDVNGRILDRKTMGEDFFWAIRGGGGSSFGVILEWKIKLVRVPESVTAFTVWRKHSPKSIKLVQRWQKRVNKFPEDLFMRIYFQNPEPIIPGGKRIIQVSFQGLYLGTADKLIEWLHHNFPEFELNLEDCSKGRVVKKGCKQRPCILKECFEFPWIKSALFFAGRDPTKEPLEYLVKPNLPATNNFMKAKSDFVTTPIPAEAWTIVKKLFLEEDRPLILLDAWGGKMNRISESEIPFPHRKGNLYKIEYMVFWNRNDEEESKKHIEWMRRIYSEMEPFVSKSPRASYLNYRDIDLGMNSQDYDYYISSSSWGEKYFKDNFHRLALVKAKVDPHNFFRFEQSIPPLHQEL